ncbi:MAG: nucleotidyltransferase domain-containing protein [Oligoflexia bacterium]|nr:nucleotidyltransferase domain-containing protein [Oligoflexia bacterium]
MAKAKDDKKLKQIVEVLKEEFKPSRMFLFGSRADGKAHKDSDYDFVLVVPGNKKQRITNMSKARELLHQTCDVSADVFIYSQKEFDEWKDELSSIPETALNTGLEIDLGQ